MIKNKFLLTLMLAMGLYINNYNSKSEEKSTEVNKYDLYKNDAVQYKYLLSLKKIGTEKNADTKKSKIEALNKLDEYKDVTKKNETEVISDDVLKAAKEKAISRYDELGYSEKVKVFFRNHYGKMSLGVFSIIVVFTAYKYFTAEEEESEESEEEN